MRWEQGWGTKRGNVLLLLIDATVKLRWLVVKLWCTWPMKPRAEATAMVRQRRAGAHGQLGVLEHVPGEGNLPGGPGQRHAEPLSTVQAGQAQLNLFRLIFQYSNQIKLVKYEKGTSTVPTISKLCKAVDLGIMNNFSHWPNFIFPLDFTL
jgi:hypothetical protein